MFLISSVINSCLGPSFTCSCSVFMDLNRTVTVGDTCSFNLNSWFITRYVENMNSCLRRSFSLNLCVRSGKEREHNLQAGDNVEVCEGELINLQGKILSVDGNKITIMPKHEDLKVRAQSCTQDTGVITLTF